MSEWIKLSEQRPYIGQAIVMAYHHKNVVNYSVGFKWAGPTIDPCWTHWLPIPEVPKPDPFDEWKNNAKGERDFVIYAKSGWYPEKTLREAFQAGQEAAQNQ